MPAPARLLLIEEDCMTDGVREILDEMSLSTLTKILRTLETAVDELGANTPIRQVMALIVVAIANKAERPVGVRDVDRELGDLKSGTASKLLRSMMHVETERKPGVANTIRSERDPLDLRRWDLFVTSKGADALAKITKAAEGK